MLHFGADDLQGFGRFRMGAFEDHVGLQDASAAGQVHHETIGFRSTATTTVVIGLKGRGKQEEKQAGQTASERFHDGLDAKPRWGWLPD
ncbi:hypothetical protein AZSI13_25030 [Azospira sp. I13]|nr:hypothetical protein AZSI13_25030 [Azospira sp. I13]